MSPRPSRRGFTLMEVVLATAIFTFAVLALVGLLGPSLRSAGEVEVSGKVPGVMNQVQAWIDATSFDAVFEGVRDEGTIELVAFARSTGDAGSQETWIRRRDDPSLPGLFADPARPVAGPVFKVDLTASPMNPGVGRRLAGDPAAYPLGHVAVEVAVYAFPVPEPGEAFDAFSRRVGLVDAPAYDQPAPYAALRQVTYPAAKPR